MKKFLLYFCFLVILTCAKEDSQAPNTPPLQIIKQYTLTASAGDGGSVTGDGTLNIFNSLVSYRVQHIWEWNGSKFVKTAY